MWIKKTDCKPLSLYSCLALPPVHCLFVTCSPPGTLNLLLSSKVICSLVCSACSHTSPSLPKELTSDFSIVFHSLFTLTHSKINSEFRITHVSFGLLMPFQILGPSILENTTHGERSPWKQGRRQVSTYVDPGVSKVSYLADFLPFKCDSLNYFYLFGRKMIQRISKIVHLPVCSSYNQGWVK